MKIAMFVYEFPPKIIGGLGTYASEITRQFILKGHDVSVFTMNDDEGSLPVRELWRGIEIHRPKHVDISDSLPLVMTDDIKRWGRGVDLFSKVLVYNCLSAAKLVNEIVLEEAINYDIVVVHDWLSSLAGAAIKKELGLPFAFHVHSTENGRTMGMGSKVISGIEQRSGDLADIIVTVSHSMAEELAMLNFDIGKVRVCHNGVDPERYSPNSVSKEKISEVRSRYGIGEEDPMAFFLGRLVWVKGVDKLIMAVPQILDEIPDFKLLIIGIGDMKHYLKKLVSDLKIGDAVKFCFEFLSEEERIAHYAACDVAVFPSLYEPFGIVALEAMSMEKPVVVGSAGICGLREIVVNSGPEQCGFHVNPHDPADIAKGVIQALKDPEKARWMGKNGRCRVLKHFTWDTVAERTIRIYEEILE